VEKALNSNSEANAIKNLANTDYWQSGCKTYAFFDTEKPISF